MTPLSSGNGQHDPAADFWRWVAVTVSGILVTGLMWYVGSTRGTIDEQNHQISELWIEISKVEIAPGTLEEQSKQIALLWTEVTKVEATQKSDGDMRDWKIANEQQQVDAINTELARRLTLLNDIQRKLDRYGDWIDAHALADKAIWEAKHGR